MTRSPFRKQPSQPGWTLTDAGREALAQYEELARLRRERDLMEARWIKAHCSAVLDYCTPEEDDRMRALYAAACEEIERLEGGG
jgi:hypothetical protein